MPEPINEIQTRIVGSLVEKQLTTPEYYPLTLNALVSACNQKTNRDPVTAYDERTVMAELERLRDRNIVYVFYGSTSRVPKYKHMLPSVYELDPAETALVCVTMLRGPQTIGELRERTSRLFQFDTLGDVQTALDGLIRRDDPLIVRLDPQPGQKESRFAQLLSGPIDVEAFASAHPSAVTERASLSARFEELETKVEELSAQIEDILKTFEEFRKQFE